VAVADEFTPQGVANTMWAHAKMGEAPGAALLAALEKRAVAVAGVFNPQDVANTMWAYATLGIKPGAALLEALEKRAVAVAGGFNPQDVANTMWAYATLGITPGAALLAALEKQAVAVAGAFNPQAVSNILSAYATLGITPGAALLAALEKRAVAVAGAFDPQAVVNLLWARAVFASIPGAAISCRTFAIPDAMVSALVSPRGSADHQDVPEALVQVHQYLLSCELEAGRLGAKGLPASTERLKSWLGDRGREAMMAARPSPSRSQQDVARSLEAAFPGIVLEEEGAHEATGYDLDIVLDSNRLAEGVRNSVWAVEFDGPTHFLQVGRGPAIRAPAKAPTLIR
jgi:hypothetical protein